MKMSGFFLFLKNDIYIIFNKISQLSIVFDVKNQYNSYM